MNYMQKVEFIKKNIDLINSVKNKGVEIVYENIIDDE